MHVNIETSARTDLEGPLILGNEIKTNQNLIC